MVMTKSAPKSSQIIVLTKQEQFFLERKQDVLLLLEHLAESEEVTVKLVLDRLYEIGANNLINQKVPAPLLKRVLRGATKVSKPAFRIIAFYWFKKNCPRLLTDWLLEQVAFSATETTNKEVVEVSPNSLQGTESEQVQIKQLQSKVRLLTNLLIIAIAVGGSSFTWLIYSMKLQPESNLQPADVSLVNINE